MDLRAYLIDAKKRKLVTIYDVVKESGIRGWKVHSFWAGQLTLKEDEERKLMNALSVLTREIRNA